MPIKQENKGRYPANWKQIRANILDRAGHCCEFCGVPNHVYRHRRTYCWTRDAGLAESRAMDGEPISYIVLTIAHLDHTPEHCEPSNLRALCQRCHLRYDHAHHIQSLRQSRKKSLEQAGQLQLRF